MKKTLSFLLTLLLSCTGIMAQTPQYMYSGTGQSGNGFPFSSGLNKVQWLYQTATMFPTAPSGSITKIYLKSASSTTSTLTNLEVKIAPTTLTALSTAAFETAGFTTVLTSASQVLTVTNGQWFELTLTTPFPFTAGQSFIVEVSKTGATNQILASQSTETYTGRLHANSATALVPSGNMTRVGELGFDISSIITTSITGPDTVCLGATGTLFGSPAGGTWSSSNTSVATITAAGVVSGLTNGTTTITYTSGSGTATKNVYVKSYQQATVSLAATPNDTVCVNTPYTINATATLGGSAANYSWFFNNVAPVIPNNLPTFTLGGATAGLNSIKCILISSLACVKNDTATIPVFVTPSVTTGVSISASQTGTICAGTAVTFTASPVNGGTSPSYQWKKNTINVGTNSATYTDATLLNSDVITCSMTSNAYCATPATSNSAAIQVTVVATTAPQVVVTATDSSVCRGELVTFNATPTTGGSAPTYQWFVNNVAASITASSYTFAPAHQDKIRCTLTSNASCISSATALSDTVNMTVFNLPTVTITRSGSVFTSSVATGNQWYRNGTAITGATTQTYTATQDGYYKSLVSDANSCTALSDSMFYQHNVSVPNVVNGYSVKIFPNPATDKITLELSSLVQTRLQASVGISNQLGQVVATQSVHEGSNPIALESLSRGIYFLKISVGDSQRIYKVVKE